MMNLELLILESLENVHPLMMPERTLRSDVNLRMTTPPTQSEFDRALRSLDGKRHVVLVPHEDRGLMAKITAAGQARLAE